jgi:hypothetical protein
MGLSKAGLVQPQGLSTMERDLLRLAGADLGRLIYNETTRQLQQWDGLVWRDVLIGPTVASSIVTGSFPMTQITGNLDGARVSGAIGAGQLSGNIDGGFY